MCVEVSGLTPQFVKNVIFQYTYFATPPTMFLTSKVYHMSYNSLTVTLTCRRPKTRMMQGRQKQRTGRRSMTRMHGRRNMT